MPGFTVPGAGGGHPSVSLNSHNEYYYNYFWEIDNLFESDGWAAANSHLVSIRECSMPTFTVNKDTYQGASLEYKYAKSVTWEDIKVTWYDSIGLFGTMRQWRGNVWSPECGMSDANHYKRESRLGYYLPTGERRNKWQLINSWPSQIRHGDLTYTSSDVKIIEVTITYDWAVEQPA